MGLDQYAYVNGSDGSSESSEDSRNEIAYWRKHPNLHGWMESLYNEKGGQEETFNCVNVQLTEEDINRLEEDINDGNLPDTVGFFFGQSEPEDKVGDLEFVKKAREAITEGYDVYYTSWW